MRFEVVSLGGLSTAVVSRKELARQMVEDVKDGCNPPRLVFSSNGQGLSLAASDENFKKVMDAADIIHADGQSIVYASRLIPGPKLPERVATTDFFHDAAEAAQESGISFYMLGATEDDNKKAVQNIQKKYPKLKIVGRHHGYFRENESEVIDDINRSGADVLWVALGKPYQEHWCVNNRDQLNVSWVKTCGGLYDFLSGKSQRAPEWVQKLGFEWLYRVALDPKRLFMRYAMTNPHAIYLLLFKSDGQRK